MNSNPQKRGFSNQNAHAPRKPKLRRILSAPPRRSQADSNPSYGGRNRQREERSDVASRGAPDDSWIASP